MRYGVLGPLAVWTDAGEPVKVAERKTRALLADLLLHEGRTVSAGRLVEDLWPPGARPANPAATLQTRVWQLRRALAAAEPGARDLVVRAHGGYRLAAAPESVDAGRFTALLTRARTADDPHVRAARLRDALALWRGGAYEDVADQDFARAAVARLEETRLTAVEDLAHARLALGEHGPLAAELGALADRHPLRERLRTAHMTALYRAGRQSEALAAYDDLRRHLARELGLAPGPETAALQRAILAQDPALRTAAGRSEPPAGPGRPAAPVPAMSPAGPAPPPANLPAPVTDLVGRDRELTDVRKLLRTERLVTLTGPGGVGKTRLALEAAAQALTDAPAGLPGDFPDGVWLAELAGRRCYDDPADVIAETLGVHDTEGRPTHDVLADAVRAKRLLLVLDNCEHLVESVAPLAARLLRAAPGLRILATSQEQLAIAGETLYAVPPLALPPPGHDAATTGTTAAGTPAARTAAPSAECLHESSAVRLFLARAAAAAPGFQLEPGNAAAVAAICRRLDGIPLALELAATRVRALGVHRIAERLDDRFRVLAAGGARRDAPERQRTLRATIEWSWELLTPQEQAVLRRLSVFATGTTLPAAEAVCAGTDIDPADVADLLARLVDRSLVVTTPGPEGRRYGLLESVAAYGLAELTAAGEHPRALRHHASHHADLAERAAPHLFTRTQARWLSLLDAEAANLRRALDTATTTGDATLALRLANALAWYWFLRGRHRESTRALSRALETGTAATAAGADAAHVAALRASVAAWHAGFALLDSAVRAPARAGEARTYGTYETDETKETEEKNKTGETGDGGTPHAPTAGPAFPGDAADPRAVWFLAHAEASFGSIPRAAALADRALGEFRARGDRWGEAAALVVRSTVALFRGDLAALARHSATAARIFDELGEDWGRLEASEAMAGHAEITGDYARAARLHRDDARRAEELGLWAQQSYRLAGLGRVTMLTGDLDESRRLHERAMALATAHFDPAGEEFAEIGLGMVARRAGRPETAEGHLRPWLEWWRGLDCSAAPRGVALIAAELGFLAEQRGDADEARAMQREGLAAALASEDPRAAALALEGLAGVETLTGNHAPAARLLGTAAALRAAAGAPLPAAERGDVDRITARATTALGAAGFAAAHEQGRGMALTDHPAAHPEPHRATATA
ncbi:BTAD domain-containing putative transcriptional regulator [Streptomyces sp. WMMC500]|uniref:BTAD domain-containing putative transcriptional regulator n=1 Tax=Streptomyces sp. WMMC500 TaxID=3015154 RepID=UPI00248CFCBA|nr:BTAD domain-containing putative transcriptional regulator [Streptomyces sp. WMMC500]WBB59458.1 BTAD domain-containing putative transcriptional regulator [Streptomyces sp. WMMC500]